MERTRHVHEYEKLGGEEFASRSSSATFNFRFSRARRLLYLVAHRVLGDREGAELAIENCWRSSARNTPRFDDEGAFRSWLLRRVIDEALIVLCQRVSCREAAIGRGQFL